MNNKFSFNMLVLYLIFLFFLFASCSDSQNLKKVREEKSKNNLGDINIGAVASWKLEKSEYIWEGLELAIEEINKNGGINGRKIHVIKKDDQGLLDKGLEIAEEFSYNTELLAVLGHSYSYISLPCSILYQYNGLILISPTSDSPELSNRESFDYIFQTSPNTDDYVIKLVQFLNKLKLSKVIVFNQNDTFGSGFADFFEKTASGYGINIISRITYSEGAPRMFFKKKLLACNYFYDFDSILIAGDGSSALDILDLCNEYSINAQLLGTEKFDLEKVISKIVDIKRNIIFPSSFSLSRKSELVKRFVTQFKRKYGFTPRSRAARWYNAVKFLAFAMKQARELTPREIIRSIKRIKSWDGVLGKMIFYKKKENNILNTDIIINSINRDGFIVRLDEEGKSN